MNELQNLLRKAVELWPKILPPHIKNLTGNMQCPECEQKKMRVVRRVTDNSAFWLTCEHVCECWVCDSQHYCDGEIFLNSEGNEIEYPEYDTMAQHRLKLVETQGILPLEVTA